MSISRYEYTERNLAEINPLLASIIYSRKTCTNSANDRPLIAEVSREELFFLYDFIKSRPEVRHVLEIGCAMGISSVAILSALKTGNGSFSLLSCDPYQDSDVYSNIGRRHVALAGFTQFECPNIGSETLLPQLVAEHRRYDMVFQDGLHTLDHSLLEFHYIDRLTRVGGFVVYDDVDMNHMNRFIRYISLYPHWELIACAGRPAWSAGRRLLGVCKAMFSPIVRCIPRNLGLEFFSDTLYRLDGSLGLNSSMIALRKTAEDSRTYTYNAKF